ncbi:MAG: CRISPR-associated endonuclease Cas3'', partial [Planctomycetes bacterium]|nr:CRISPR-associated endonuclease Cas3'' [Planctomycetota bacterium]
MPYYAHTHPDQPQPGHRWQLLVDHLRGVASLAEQFAQEMWGDAANLSIEQRELRDAFVRSASIAGLLHDIGKYASEFQRRLRGETRKLVPHAAIGAAEAVRQRAIDVAFAVAGHHGGVPSRVHLAELARHDPPTQLLQLARAELGPRQPLECGEFPGPLRTPSSILRAEFYIRLLYSVLVDADYLDTERHIDPDLATARTSMPLEASDLLERLLGHIVGLCRRSSDSQINLVRQQVFHACLGAADMPPGFFSLTVPTGGGKTLSSMVFALKHASQNHLRRIIYVLPYLNIIEQNAQVLREALGPDLVLEHHTLSDGFSAEAATCSRIRSGAAQEPV